MRRSATILPAAPPAGLDPMPVHVPARAQVGKLPHASPSIRRFARELGVPWPRCSGSGPKGRITQDDVRAFVKGVMAGRVQTAAQKAKAPAAAPGLRRGGIPGLLPWPKVDFAKFGPMSSARTCRASRRSAARTCTATG
jgi:pyruvate dehydrogenase E2 component (dihydrolipoamide acetyltransferase)